MLPTSMAVLGLPGPRPPDTGDAKKIVIFGDGACGKTSCYVQVYEPTVFKAKYKQVEDRPIKTMMVMGKTGAGKSNLCNFLMNTIFKGKKNKTENIQKKKKKNIQKRDKHGGNQSTGKGKQDLVHEGLFSSLDAIIKDAAEFHVSAFPRQTLLFPDISWTLDLDVMQEEENIWTQDQDDDSEEEVEPAKPMSDQQQEQIIDLDINAALDPDPTDENSLFIQQTFHLTPEVMEAEAGQNLQNSVDTKPMIPPQKMSTQQPVGEILAEWLGTGQAMVGRPRCAKMDPADSSPALDLLDLFADALFEVGAPEVEPGMPEISDEEVSIFLKELGEIHTPALSIPEEYQTNQEARAGIINVSEDFPRGSKTSHGKFLQRKVGGFMIDSFPTGVLLSVQDEASRMKIILTSTVLDLIIPTSALLDLIITVMVVSSLVVMTGREDKYKMMRMFESKENLKELVA